MSNNTASRVWIFVYNANNVQVDMEINEDRIVDMLPAFIADKDECMNMFMVLNDLPVGAWSTFVSTISGVGRVTVFRTADQ